MNIKKEQLSLYLLYGIILIGLGSLLVNFWMQRHDMIFLMIVTISSIVNMIESLIKDESYIKKINFYLLCGVILILLINLIINLWLGSYQIVIFSLLILIYPLILIYNVNY